MKLRVECYSGNKADERPVRFYLGEQLRMVEEILDQWYGILLGGFGCGAVLGALVMQRARSRWSADVIVSAGIAIFGLTTIAAGTLRELAPLTAILFT